MPVQLHGVIAVQGRLMAEERQQMVQGDLDISVSGLDASSSAAMQLEVGASRLRAAGPPPRAAGPPPRSGWGAGGAARGAAALCGAYVY